MLKASLALLLALAGGAHAQITAIAPFPGGTDGQLQYNGSYFFEGVTGSLVQGSTLTLVEVRATTAAFGAGAVKSTFTSTGSLFMASGASITLSGAQGWLTTRSSVTASAFFGYGGSLSGVPSSASIVGVYLPLTGGGMSGEIRMVNSSMTLSGPTGFITSASSINASSFFGPLVGNADTASRLFSTGAAATSGYLCRGQSVYGFCLEAKVETAGASGSTSPVSAGALYTHEQLTGSSAHGATAANTASQIVTRDGSGNFAAGTITAALSGNATTASALAADPSDAPSGFLSRGITANGTVEQAKVDTVGTSGSTNPISGGALYTHEQLQGSNAHGATSANTASMIVARDASGNFSAGKVNMSSAAEAGSLSISSAGAIGGHLTVNGNIGATKFLGSGAHLTGIIGPGIAQSTITLQYHLNASGCTSGQIPKMQASGVWGCDSDSGGSVTTLNVSSFSVRNNVKASAATAVFSGTSSNTVSGMTFTMYINTTAQIRCSMRGWKVNADAGTECGLSVAFDGTVPSVTGGESNHYTHRNGLTTTEMPMHYFTSGRLSAGTISVAYARWRTLGSGSCNDGAATPSADFLFECFAFPSP